MQIFTFLLPCEFVLQEKSPGRRSCKRNWREYGDSLFLTAKSLCVENKIFYHVVLLVKGFGFLLPRLAAHSKESLRQNKKMYEFSLVFNSPRTAYPGVCSYPKWSTLLLLEFPTLDAEGAQLSGKQLLSCCGLQMEISFRLPWYHGQRTVAAVTWAAEHFLMKDKNLREVWGGQVSVGSRVFIPW